MTAANFELKSLDLQRAWAAEPPLPDFVLPGLAMGTVGNVIGTGGTGKTFLMLATVLSVGIGKDVGEIWGSNPKPGNAIFLSLEDPEVELNRRLHVFSKTLTPTDKEEARERVHVLPGAGKKLSLGKVSSTGGLAIEGWFAGFEKYVVGLRPRLLVIDTLNRLLGGVSENDGSAMGWFIGEIEALAQTAGCAIVLCHHTSKAALGSGNAGEAHAARGSSVITDNARWQVNLYHPPVKDGQSEPDRSRKTVHLEFSKLNYTSPIPTRDLQRSENGVLSGPNSSPLVSTGTDRPTEAMGQRGQKLGLRVRA